MPFVRSSGKNSNRSGVEMHAVQRWAARQEGGQKYPIESPRIVPTGYHLQRHRFQWVALYQWVQVGGQEKSFLPYEWLGWLLNTQGNRHEMFRHW